LKESVEIFDATDMELQRGPVEMILSHARWNFSA